MHFGVSDPNTVYKFGDADIKSECDIKDLGVLVSNNLKNSFNCIKLIDQTKRSCFMLFRCLKSSDPTCLLIAYKSYISPILKYNLWCGPFILLKILIT